MEDREIYNTIMADDKLKKYLDEDNYKRLYRAIKQNDISITFKELTVFLKNAGIDIFAKGVVPIEAFADDKSLTEFNFSNINTIEAGAFQGSGIKKVVLNKGQTVGLAAFKDSAVEELYLGSGVTVGTAAFARCKNLRELYIKGDVKLETLAFASCRGLEEVVLDDGRTEWPQGLFAGIKHIDYVTLPFPFQTDIFDGDTEIDVLYLNCSRTDYNPDEIRSIGRYPATDRLKIKEIQYLK